MTQATISMLTSRHPALTYTGTSRMHLPTLHKAAEVLDNLLATRNKRLAHVWGYDPNVNNKEHHSGRALDFMVHSDRAAGDQIANYVIANKDRLGLVHIIWRQRIYRGPKSTSTNPKGVWQAMADRGSTTQNHMDHPHVLFAATSYTPPKSTTPPKAATVLTVFLSRGSKGPEVTLLQKMLNKMDKAGLAEDGSFGPSTETKVKAAQKKRGLAVDGKVGPATRTRLNADWTAFNKPAPAPAPPAPVTPSPTPAPVSPKFTPEQEAWQKLATGTALFKDRTADDPETAPRIPLGLMIENLTDLAIEIRSIAAEIRDLSKDKP